MDQQKIFTIFLVAGLVALVPIVYSATQQVYQAGGGFEITTDTANQTLNISTKATDGGSIQINTRQGGGGTGINIDTSNNVSFGGTITGGVWQGTAIADTYVSDTITVGASGVVNDLALSANVSLLGTAIEKGEIANSGTLSFDWADSEVADTITASNYLPLGGGTMTGTLNINIADSIYFESSRHAITYNDGTGNFNIRVGNTYQGASGERITEAGYAFHTEWSQGSGWIQWNISQNGLVNDPVSWNDTLQFSTGGILRISGLTSCDTIDTSSNGTLSCGTDDDSPDSDAEVPDAITVGATGSVNDGALSANVSLLGNSISGGEIVDNTIEEVDLEVTNAPTDNYILSYDSATGGFTWVVDANSGGDITGVTAGTNLSGGGTSGTVTLNVVSSPTFSGSVTVSPGQLIGGIGAVTTAGTLDWNHVTNARSGGGYSLLLGSAANGPGGGSYFHPFSFEYSSKDGSGNLTQFAIPYATPANEIYFRGRYSGVWNGWKRLWHDSNDGAGSGLDADTLDGISSGGFSQLGSAIEKGELANSGTLAFDWADSEVSDTLTIGASGSVNDGALSANVSLLGNSISGSEIVDNTIEEVDLEVTNAPTDNYILSFDLATGGFTWVPDANSGGDITGVTAGNGLTGGGTTGTVTLNVGAGTGISVAADTVAVNTAAALTWTALQTFSTTGTDIVADKIDAGTVDPVYTIYGKRYATYMAGMTGLKEETTGVIRLNKESRSKNYEYTIDFNNLEKDSDMWLFAQTINIDGRSFVAEDGKVYRTTANELFDRMTLLLTPGFDGRVWYEKDVKNRKITVFGDKNGEVSFRLTAPRFDWKSWSNFALDGDHEGFNLDKLLK